MMCLILTSVVLLLTVGEGESNSQCEDQVPVHRKKCFEDLGLNLAEMPTNLDTLHPSYTMLQSTFTMMDPAQHCSDPAKYSEATQCAINVTKSCYDVDGTRNVIMNADDVIAGMQVLCEKRQELDMECFKHFYATVEECTKYHRRGSNGPSSSDTTDIICAKDDLQYDCMEAIMTPMCGENTTSVFLDQMDKYTITPACVQRFKPSRQRTRYFASLNKEPSEGNPNNAGHPLFLFSPSLLILSLSLVLGLWG